MFPKKCTCLISLIVSVRNYYLTLYLRSITVWLAWRDVSASLDLVHDLSNSSSLLTYLVQIKDFPHMTAWALLASKDLQAAFKNFLYNGNFRTIIFYIQTSKHKRMNITTTYKKKEVTKKYILHFFFSLNFLMRIFHEVSARVRWYS